MKTKTLILIGTLFLSSIFLGCEQEEISSTPSSPANLKSSYSNSKTAPSPDLSKFDLAGTGLETMVEDYIVDHIDATFVLDVNDSYVVENNDNDIKSIVVNFDPVIDAGQERIALVLEETSPGNHTVLGGYNFVSEINSNTATTTIKQLNGDNFVTVEADLNAQAFNIDIHDYSPHATDPVNCTSDNVLNCIEDAYTNHGWTSVILWAATLVDPAVGVTVAVSCVITYCIVLPIVTGKL